MAVKKKKAPSHEQSLWEQLIDRINTATLPDSNIERNRFELLELLSQSIINTPQFFARLGTILSHSVYADAIIIYEQTNDQIRTIFPSLVISIVDIDPQDIQLAILGNVVSNVQLEFNLIILPTPTPL